MSEEIKVSDEIKEFVEQRIEKVKEEARREAKQTLKVHFDYCCQHSGRLDLWLRNELFGKD